MNLVDDMFYTGNEVTHYFHWPTNCLNIGRFNTRNGIERNRWQAFAVEDPTVIGTFRS